MKIKMKLLSDTIFGNGLSVPGAEDISVLTDEDGFVYYKASTFKGIFRQEFTNYLYWIGKSEQEVNNIVKTLFGESGDSNIYDDHKIIFNDFTFSDNVKSTIKTQSDDINVDTIINMFTYTRTFTAIEDGMTKEGSLRSCRCVKSDLVFYSNISFPKEYEEYITETLSCIKWIGTMRNRGFGKVKFTVIKED